MLGRFVLAGAVGGALPTAIESACVSVCCGELASATRAVKLAVPAVVGVPETTPVDAFRLRPEGREPALMLQAYGVLPPVATRVCE
jgi:hypothetical protein